MEETLKGAPTALPRSKITSTQGLMEHDEEQLSKLALGGDRSAWEALIARHQRRVLVSLLARGIRVDRAKEMAQEVWVRLLQQQRQGQLASLRLPGLALAQASFLAMDELRRARRESSEGIGVDGRAGEELGAHLPSVETRIIDRMKLSFAAEVLEQCPSKSQQVFQLVYDKPELPHAEVARRVGLSVQRVRQILCEVRKKLRNAIEDDHD